MQVVKFEWAKMHAFLVIRYQVHGHASFAVMHDKRIRSAACDRWTAGLQVCLHI
jgi:hypothetical protein